MLTIVPFVSFLDRAALEIAVFKSLKLAVYGYTGNTKYLSAFDMQISCQWGGTTANKERKGRHGECSFRCPLTPSFSDYCLLLLIPFLPAQMGSTAANDSCAVATGR